MCWMHCRAHKCQKRPEGSKETYFAQFQKRPTVHFMFFWVPFCKRLPAISVKSGSQIWQFSALVVLMELHLLYPETESHTRALLLEY